MTGNIFTVDTKFGSATMHIAPGEGDVLCIVSIGALPTQRITMAPETAGEIGKAFMAAAQLAKVPTHG